MKRRLFNTVLAAVIFSLIGLGRLVAQAPPADQSGDQEPGVARLSLIQGDAATQRGDSAQWAAAVVNTPVVSGDNVSTGDQSRAELQLDYADLLRMDQHTQLKVADLANNHLQIQLADGLIDFSILRGAQANVEVDTPNMSVQPTGEGEYRIEVASPTETRVIVRNGGARISTQEGSTTVQSGQMITIEGAGADAQYRIDPAPELDEWDQWNLDRNRTILGAQSWDHTNQYYTGSQDLDQNGQWVNSPEYGDVWQPNVEEENPNWAPYRDGSWCYTPYYGWTWVGAEPWGWAPYHYGRWFLWGNRWSWWPGAIGVGIRPLWGPAWVSFMGLGWGAAGFALGGFGHIGWLALGPLDIFHPWWGRWGRGGYEMAALYHGPRDPHGIGSNLGRAWTNERVRAGMTAVDSRTFTGGRVTGHAQSVSLQGLRQARTISGRLPVEPTRESMSASHMAARPSAIPSRSFAQTRFFSRSASPQRGLTGGTPGAAFSRGGFSPASRPAPVPMSRPSGSFARPAPGNWQPNSSTSMANGANRPSYTQPRPSRGGGWQRFAQPAPGGGGSAAQRGGLPAQRGFGTSRPASPQPGLSGGWQRFNQTGRPPLNLNKPIMNQRASRSYGGYSSPNGARSYTAPRSYSGSPYGGAMAPRGGGYSAPRTYGYGAPSGGYSAPRGYGGSSAARGGYRAPRAHYSAPRGGGGGHHGGGGGGHHGGGGHGRR
jgi:hypothetical protein